MSWDLAVVTGFALTGFFFIILHLVKKEILKNEDKDLELYRPFAEIEIDVYLLLSLLSFTVLSFLVNQIVVANNIQPADTLGIIENITYWWAQLLLVVILFRSVGIVWRVAVIGFAEFKKAFMGLESLEDDLQGGEFK